MVVASAAVCATVRRVVVAILASATGQNRTNAELHIRTH